LSVLTYTYLYTILFFLLFFKYLTPHVLSEWMVEVCRFWWVCVRFWFMFRAGGWCLGFDLVWC
jgi:hypothetical protein